MSGSPPKIRVVGDPVLAEPAADVTDFGPELTALIEDMFASLAVAEGVGRHRHRRQGGSRLGLEETEALGELTGDQIA